MVRLRICSLVFCLALAGNLALAQDKGSDKTQAYPVCVPDCPNDPFICSQTVTWFMGGCSWTATYCWRHACGVFCDVQVTDIKCNTFPPCTGMTVQQVFEMAAEAAILDISITKGLLPCRPSAEGQCVTSWRVSAASCWQWRDLGMISPDWHVTYCDIDACCLFLYEVCLRNGMYVVTPISSTGNPFSCPPGCYKICN